MVFVYLESFPLLGWLNVVTLEPWVVCSRYVNVFLYNFILFSCVIKVKELMLSVKKRNAFKNKKERDGSMITILNVSFLVKKTKKMLGNCFLEIRPLYGTPFWISQLLSQVWKCKLYTCSVITFTKTQS